MDQQTKTLPAEAVDLYTRFIHGEISRRAFVAGVQKFTVVGLTAASSAPVAADDARCISRLRPRAPEPPQQRPRSGASDGGCRCVCADESVSRR